MTLPNTFYGITVNGWMETDVFVDWFDAFADENKGCQMLLLSDGHDPYFHLCKSTSIIR